MTQATSQAAMMNTKKIGISIIVGVLLIKSAVVLIMATPNLILLQRHSKMSKYAPATAHRV